MNSLERSFERLPDGSFLGHRPLYLVDALALFFFPSCLGLQFVRRLWTFLYRFKQPLNIFIRHVIKILRVYSDNDAPKR